jgi:hypothetical protein
MLDTLSMVVGISVVLNRLSMFDSAAVLDSNSSDADDEDPASGVVDSVSVRKLLLKCAGSEIIHSQYHPLTHANKVGRISILR